MPEPAAANDASMRLSISHTTTYRFDRPVSHGLQRLRLTPKATQGQTILDWTMDYQGASEALSYEDQNRNTVRLLAVYEGASEVIITCRGTVQTRDNAGVIGQHSGHLPLWAFLGPTPLTRPGAKIRQLAALVARSDGAWQNDGGQDDAGKVARLHRLSAAIREAVSYGNGATGVATTAEEAMAQGQGVCQDHSHIFIAAARHLGCPARYVSGYLMLNDRIDQAATHAWAEAHVTGLGWVGFDVSNGISPDPRYVRLATGRDYQDAAPITGISFGAGTSELQVALAVAQQTIEQ